MKIKNFETLHADATGQGFRSLSFLKIETDTNLVGWSEFVGFELNKRMGLDSLIKSMMKGLIGKDPREIVAKRLTEDIPKDACILAYSMNVEKGVIENLASLFPIYRDHLLNISNNFFDLRKPFQARYFLTPEMKKLNGLKTVLPILVPEMKNEYKDLDLVHNGGEAMDIYKKLGEAVAKEVDIEIINRYRKSLTEYCKLDTKAMVDILRKLKEMVN